MLFILLGLIIAILPKPRRASAKVSQLLVYPIKGCSPIRPSNWPINKYGLELDRFWVIANNEKFFSQREIPKMAFIKIEITLLPTPKYNGPISPGVYDRKGYLTVSGPGMDRTVDIKFRAKNGCDGLVGRRISIWEKETFGFDEGDEAANWFSEYLGIPEVRLFVKCQKTIRPTNDIHTPTGIFPQVSFSDCTQFLVVTEESVNAVNDKLKMEDDKLDFPNQQVSHLNFRANILVVGQNKSLLPFSEENWKIIDFYSPKSVKEAKEGVRFYAAKMCKRCQVPSINLETAKQGLQPGLVMMKNKWRRVDAGASFEACFGMYLVTDDVGKVLRVGDYLDVVEGGVTHHDKIGIWH